jgi:ribonuclease G
VEKELIIHSTATEVEIALLENSKLVEIHRQKSNANFSVGDVFIGRIKKLMPGLNAAFIDIGYKKDAFLHYTDLGPKLPSLLKFTQASLGVQNGTYLLDKYDLGEEIQKSGKIDQVLTKKQSAVLVQILKEPISTKGPRLTCEINLPGRHMVLTPFANSVAVSKKIINPEERKRLQILVESIKPKNFGVIVRTAAEGRKVADLHEELNELLIKWKEIHEALKNVVPPKKLMSELDKTSSILRDILNDTFNKIVVDDKELYDGIKSYLLDIAPEKVKILHMHRSRVPIFDTFGVTRQIKSSFGKTATMSSGAYLIIEHTEAMHVIDVNSGPKNIANIQDDAILNVNLEAAEEIARQLRLRDIGGLIIIDFIDLRNSEHKRVLEMKMKEFMRPDRAQHTILPLSRFGLMQITRERVKPEVKINTDELCPTCQGTGKVNASVLVIEEIYRDLKYILHARPSAKFSLQVHPFVHAYMKRGFPSQQMKLFFEFKKWIAIIPNADFHIHEYRFFDKSEDEIRLN